MDNRSLYSKVFTSRSYLFPQAPNNTKQSTVDGTMRLIKRALLHNRRHGGPRTDTPANRETRRRKKRRGDKDEGGGRTKTVTVQGKGAR